MAHYDIFRHHLLITAPSYGHALWDPNPGNLYPAVEIGDVGYIHKGKFRRLFNALLSADHPSHSNFGVPEYHEQLTLNIDPHIETGNLSPHTFFSANVKLGIESDLWADAPRPEGEVSFLCSPMNQGALLYLPINAKSEDTVANTIFGKWLIKNIDCWFAWARKCELGVERMEDIILVTGTHRTRSCGNVAFPGVQDAQVSFRARVDHGSDVVNINWQFSPEPERNRGAFLNCGPNGENLPEDQCIFIRGFRVTRKYKILLKLKGAAGPNPDPEESDEESDKELIPIPAIPEYRDPLHILLEFIAEGAPNCDMILIHDNDLAALHGLYDGTIGSLQQDAIIGRLRSAQLKIHEVPFVPDPSSVDNGGSANALAETVRVATLSNIFEELSASSSPSPSQGPHRVFQSHGSRENSATSMSPHPAPTNIQELIESIGSALKSYREQTGINLLEHRLAIPLRSCDSANSVMEVLQAQPQESPTYHGSSDAMTWVKAIVNLLHTLSTRGSLGEAIGVPLPPATAIFTGIGVLLDEISRVGISTAAVVNLFESIENLLRPLDICTKISPTTETISVIMRILFELLSILALGTQQVEKGLLLAQYNSVEVGSKVFGIKGVEVVRQRLDRLNQEEARTAAVHTLEVVYGLLRNMKVVMDGGESSINDCWEALVAMQQVTENMNKGKRDQAHNTSRRWLSPPDPSKNRNILGGIRFERTTAWVMHDDNFREWTATGSLLWVHGKLGSGKSVLCSTIIEGIQGMCQAGLASLAYYYFDVRDTGKQDMRGLLTSLLFQLSARSDLCCNILSTLYYEHHNGALLPSNDVLMQCLKEMVTIPKPGPMYIIVDAVDECPNGPRQRLLGLLDELVQLNHPHLHLCVTSRLESDIETILRPLSFHSISLQEKTGKIQDDIFDYVSDVVYSDQRMKKWPAEDQRLVIDTLSQKADGMFLWVSCQLEALRRCPPNSIRRVLEEFPTPLGETYENALERIDEQNWKYAHRLFQCIAVASRPLRVQELCELLALDFSGDPGSVPKFVGILRPKDPREAVLSTCSSLITTVEVSGACVVQFSHFSFGQFLMSNRIVTAGGPVSRYHISLESAHSIVTKACLSLLLQFGRIDRHTIEGCPLANYAPRYWVTHAQFGNVSSIMRSALESLFDPTNPYFSAWVSMWDVDQEWSTYPSQDTSTNPRATALYYAALCGFLDVVKWLAIVHRQDMNARGGNYATPLHATSSRGHLKVAQFLLGYGVDVNIVGNFGQSPLHLAAKGGHVEIAALLLKHEGNPDAEDIQRQTPLFYAAQAGQLEATRVLLRYGADVRVRDKNGLTALHLAARENHSEIATLLLKHGADANARNIQELTPLYCAAYDERLEVMRVLLLHGATVGARDKNGETALHLAARKNHLEMVALLLEHGADANAQNVQELTPLYCAAYDERLEVMRVLLQHSASIGPQDKSGDTVLHLAAWKNNLKMVTLLLEYRVDADPLDIRQLTPLYCAAYEGRLELTRVLLLHGANVGAQDKNGLTPLHVAAWKNHSEIAALLLEHGADANVRDNQQQTPLFHAAQEGQLETMRALLRCGVDVEVRDKNGETMLHLAAWKNYSESATLLLEHGADANVKNIQDLTPLYCAVYNGHLEVTRVLLQRGADVGARDKNGETALRLAARKNHSELIKLLLENGANADAKNTQELTPLYCAAYEGKLEATRVLLCFGADVEAQDKNGVAPLHLAAWKDHSEIAAQLLEHSANADVKNIQQLTPLHYAVQEGKSSVMLVLLRYGADIGVRNKNGETALHLAARINRPEIATLLLGCGADANACDGQGRTVLDLALRWGHRNFIMLLPKI